RPSQPRQRSGTTASRKGLSGTQRHVQTGGRLRGRRRHGRRNQPEVPDRASIELKEKIMPTHLDLEEAMAISEMAFLPCRGITDADASDASYALRVEDETGAALLTIAHVA